MDHALHHKLEATSADAMFHLTIWIRFFVNWSKEALSWRVTARACCCLNTRCIYVVQVQVSWGKRKMMNTFLVSDSLVVYSGKKTSWSHTDSWLTFKIFSRSENDWSEVIGCEQGNQVWLGKYWDTLMGPGGSQEMWSRGEPHSNTPWIIAHCGTGSGYGGGWVTQLPDTALHWCTEGGKAPYPQVDSVYTERLAGVLLLPTYSAV